MDNNIYILGAGAVGKALAVLLKMAGKEVTVIRGSIYDIPEKVETFGVQINEMVLKTDIKVTCLKHQRVFDGILVLTNKSYGNGSLAQSLIETAKNTPIVLLQNGLGIETAFVEAGFSNLYRSVLFTTCQNITQNIVKFKPVATSQIGSINGTIETLKFISDQLDSEHFRFGYTENLGPIIWKKAISNCVFNAVCTLVEADNGLFLRNNTALVLAKTLIYECVQVANAYGVGITVNDVEENLLMISKMSDGQLISTLQDINNKRPTEIETLNMAIVALAKKINLEHIVPQTKLLGELTKMKAEEAMRI